MPKCLDEVKARPPILSIASRILKERPAACSVLAAASPDDPAPTITTSTSSMAGFPSEKAWATGKDYSSSARRGSGRAARRRLVGWLAEIWLHPQRRARVEQKQPGEQDGDDADAGDRRCLGGRPGKAVERRRAEERQPAQRVV